jgi:hypothetical protein
MLIHSQSFEQKDQWIPDRSASHECDQLHGVPKRHLHVIKAPTVSPKRLATPVRVAIFRGWVLSLTVPVYVRVQQVVVMPEGVEL